MNSALLILAQDGKVPAMRSKTGWQTYHKVLGVGDIFRFRVETSGIIRVKTLFASRHYSFPASQLTIASGTQINSSSAY
jgi:hypothetical protein